MKEDKLIGYVLTNKIGNEISEFACVNKEDILKVVKAYMQYADVEWVHIATPEYDLDLNASLGIFAENYVIETCDMYKIGRASCRERVKISVVYVLLDEK